MKLGVVRGISYGLFGKPDEFGPQAKALGAGVIRAYVYWSQVEPEPGRFAWDTVDALLDQIPEGADLWLTVCSSSPWATRQKTDFLPPSPALDPDAYARFIRELTARCRGLVAYWQPDNEPSNSALLWAGTAPEYLAQLKIFSGVVRAAGHVVLGGCGYDVFSSPEGSEPRKFFDYLAEHGRDHFDRFSVNLYGDAASVPDYVDTARRFMQRHGYEKPIVAGEHGGPVLFEFPDLGAILEQTMVEAFQASPPTQSRAELAERMRQETPERRAMAALYAKMADLPPRLRMFMAGCEPELEAKRHRINARQLVQRAVLAAAAGVEVSNYWQLAPEVPGPHDPLQMMHLLFGKLPLLDYENGALSHRYPAAGAFERLAHFLSDVDNLSPVGEGLFETGPARGWIAWDRRDPFDGEDEPPTQITIPWTGTAATVTDVFGHTSIATQRDGQITLGVTDTPVFVTA